jgi:hypothetical protein
VNGNQKEFLGLQDQPITGKLGEDGKFMDDILGLGQYADALSVFIQQCQTPITIAVSGPWGSGKTSIMNMIRNKLGDKIIPVWFNCWQFSQFDLSANLSAVMMNFIRAELYKGIEDTTAMDAATETVSSIWNSTKGFLGVTAKMAASVTGIKADQAVDALIKSVDSVQSARDNMEKMVSRRLQNKEKDRVVIFIDDLDRVTPSVALELLEVMKLFLDVKGCVFVMACDFDVVKKGVATKFKSNESEIKGRSFFDKLIQLSFNMPVSAYDKKKYVKELLGQIRFQITEEDLDVYIYLLELSIGFNPRSLKILANSLTLVSNMLSIQEDNAESEKTEQANGETEQANREKIIFGLTCMERSYPELYHLFMTRLINRDKPWQFLSKELASPQQILEIDELRPLFSESSDTDKEPLAWKICQFVDYFIRNCLDTDYDGVLSNNEIDNLRNIIKLSALTARTADQSYSEEEDSRIDAITLFCKHVYEEELGSVILEASKFPRGHSRKANKFDIEDGGEYRRYCMWFKPQKSKKKFWGNNKLFYTIGIIPHDGNAISLILEVNKTIGIDEAKISSLGELPIVKDGQYTFDQNIDYASISREFGPWEITTKDGDLNVVSAKQIAQALKELIEATHNHFD